MGRVNQNFAVFLICVLSRVPFSRVKKLRYSPGPLLITHINIKLIIADRSHLRRPSTWQSVKTIAAIVERISSRGHFSQRRCRYSSLINPRSYVILPRRVKKALTRRLIKYGDATAGQLIEFGRVVTVTNTATINHAPPVIHAHRYPLRTINYCLLIPLFFRTFV